MTNNEKLKHLFMDVFLLEEGQFHSSLRIEEVDSWDSLGIVALATGVEEAFGYHMTPAEAAAIKGVPDLVRLLESKGVHFDG